MSSAYTNGKGTVISVNNTKQAKDLANTSSIVSFMSFDRLAETIEHYEKMTMPFLQRDKIQGFRLSDDNKGIEILY